MSFVIYNTATFRIFKFPHGRRHAVFDEERVAKAQRTKLINKGVLNSSWVVDTYDNMVAKEPMVTVKSLMTCRFARRTSAPASIRQPSATGRCDLLIGRPSCGILGLIN